MNDYNINNIIFFETKNDICQIFDVSKYFVSDKKY
jgi:hypothetical protein